MSYLYVDSLASFESDLAESFSAASISIVVILQSFILDLSNRFLAYLV